MTLVGFFSFFNRVTTGRDVFYIYQYKYVYLCRNGSPQKRTNNFEIEGIRNEQQFTSLLKNDCGTAAIVRRILLGKKYGLPTITITTAKRKRIV
jgi:hypothetical protein